MTRSGHISATHPLDGDTICERSNSFWAIARGKDDHDLHLCPEPRPASSKRPGRWDMSATMSAHSQASTDSRDLCHQLFKALAERIASLQRNPTIGSCGIWQQGRTRFAYIYHSKTRAQVEVWCRGDIDDLIANDPGLDVVARKDPKEGREKSFPARFRIYRIQQIPQAAEFLENVSFMASSPKRKHTRPNKAVEQAAKRSGPFRGRLHRVDSARLTRPATLNQILINDP